MNKEEYLEMLILDLEDNNLAYWESTQNEMAKALKELQQENKQYKEVIEKVRKEINEEHSIMGVEVVENWVLKDILKEV